MFRILLVCLGFFIISLCETVQSPINYYLASSYAYVTLSFLGLTLSIAQKSKLLFAYALGNILAAMLNFLMISPSMFSVIDNFYWGGVLNYCLILNALDLMVLFTGVVSVYSFIISVLHTNNNSLILGDYSLERSN